MFCRDGGDGACCDVPAAGGRGFVVGFLAVSLSATGGGEAFTSVLVLGIEIFTLLDTSACTRDKRTDTGCDVLSEEAVVFTIGLSEGISDTINTPFLFVNEFSV